MTHTMTTDNEGTPAFACTEPSSARCHFWCDNCDEGGHDSEDAEHIEVFHAECVYSTWYRDADTTLSMYLNEDGAGECATLPSNRTGEIDTEWDDCPLWFWHESEAAA